MGKAALPECVARSRVARACARALTRAACRARSVKHTTLSLDIKLEGPSIEGAPHTPAFALRLAASKQP